MASSNWRSAAVPPSHRHSHQNRQFRPIDPTTDDQIELSAGKSIIASSEWPYALAFYITALTVQLCAIRRTTPIDRLEFDDVAKKIK